MDIALNEFVSYGALAFYAEDNDHIARPSGSVELNRIAAEPKTEPAG